MDIDIALLQETCSPPEELRDALELSPYKPWLSETYPFRYMRPPRVVRVSNRVKVDWYQQVEPDRGTPGTRQVAVSGIGLPDAAVVTPLGWGEPFTAVTVYAA